MDDIIRRLYGGCDFFLGDLGWHQVSACIQRSSNKLTRCRRNPRGEADAGNRRS
jgi:hypothetical protein